MTKQAAHSPTRRALPVALLILVSIGILVGLAVLPARTWLGQRNATRDTAAELTEVESEVAELEAKLRLLETDAEVERMARENFDLVFPGEESYRILPAPSPATAPSSATALDTD